MKHFYHYCSKGLERDTLFAGDLEFVAGMNRIAVCYLLNLLAGTPVRILAFCLMSNHFHFILYGDEISCDAFVARYKKLTSMWLVRHRGRNITQKMEIGHWPVAADKLAEKIIYVLRNPVAAGFKLVPSAYRWSSASLLFCNAGTPRWGSVSAGSLSVSKRRVKGYTRVRIPDEWVMMPDGMIWPGNYIDSELAEKQFQSLGSYMYMLNNANIDRDCEKEMMGGSMVLPDGDVKLRAREIIKKLFGKDKIETCTPAERVGTASILRKEMGCSHKQLARVLHLRMEDLKLVV